MICRDKGIESFPWSFLFLRKYKTERRSPASIPVTILDLDEGQNAKEEGTDFSPLSGKFRGNNLSIGALISFFFLLSIGRNGEKEGRNKKKGEQEENIVTGDKQHGGAGRSGYEILRGILIGDGNEDPAPFRVWNEDEK